MEDIQQVGSKSQQEQTPTGNLGKIQPGQKTGGLIVCSAALESKFFRGPNPAKRSFQSWAWEQVFDE
jgi:hypothetical protein